MAHEMNSERKALILKGTQTERLELRSSFPPLALLTLEPPPPSRSPASARVCRVSPAFLCSGSQVTSRSSQLASLCAKNVTVAVHTVTQTRTLTESSAAEADGGGAEPRTLASPAVLLFTLSTCSTEMFLSLRLAREVDCHS